MPLFFYKLLANIRYTILLVYMLFSSVINKIHKLFGISLRRVIGYCQRPNDGDVNRRFFPTSVTDRKREMYTVDPLNQV